MFFIHWDLDDDPRGNVQHIARHDITPDEVAEVLNSADAFEPSRTSDNMIAFGWTSARRRIAVVYEECGGNEVYPITAYEVER